MRQSTIDSFYETISSLVITDTISRLNDSLESSKRILKQLQSEKNLTLSQVLSHVKVGNSNNSSSYYNNINHDINSNNFISSNYNIIHNSMNAMNNQHNNNSINYGTSSKRTSSLPSTSITNNKNINYHRYEPYHQNHRDYSSATMPMNHRNEYNPNVYNAAISDEYIIGNINLAMASSSSSKINRIPTVHHHLQLINNINNNKNINSKYMTIDNVHDDNDNDEDEDENENGQGVNDGDDEDDSMENLDDNEDVQNNRLENFNRKKSSCVMVVEFSELYDSRSRNIFSNHLNGQDY